MRRTDFWRELEWTDQVWAAVEDQLLTVQAATGADLRTDAWFSLDYMQDLEENFRRAALKFVVTAGRLRKAGEAAAAEAHLRTGRSYRLQAQRLDRAIFAHLARI